MNSDQKYMLMALELAKKGKGKVSPNPLVGAVIVKHDQVIGKGYHAKYGEAHAEINAINSCSEKVEGSEMFVTLEPCDHFGNTPPCSDRIIKEKIKRVVIGSIDTSENANGRSVDKLRNNGIEVVTHVLEKECLEINRPFFNFIRTGRPYIVLKVASSLDGSIATNTGDSKWISSDKSRELVHKMRNTYDGVMVGKNTVIADNPSLTVRHIKGRNPVRIVLDPNLEFSEDLNIFNNEAKTYVITSSGIDPVKETIYSKRSISLVKVDKDENGRLNILQAFKYLGNKGIRSIFVEGGSTLSDYMLKNRLVDRVNIFISPLLIGSKMKYFSTSKYKKIKDCPEIDIQSVVNIGKDIFIDGFPIYK